LHDCEKKFSKPILKPLSQILSYLFHPLLLVSFGVFSILFLDSFFSVRFALSTKFLLLGFVFLSTFIVPSGFVFLLKWQGKIDSLELHNSEERKLPILLAAFSVLFCYYSLHTRTDLQLQYLINPFLLSVTAVLVAAGLVNLIFKISLHGISMGGLAALFLVLQGNAILDMRPLLAIWFLLAGLVGMARLYLKSHNVYQYYLGFFTGFTTIYIIMQ